MLKFLIGTKEKIMKKIVCNKDVCDKINFSEVEFCDYVIVCVCKKKVSVLCRVKKRGEDGYAFCRKSPGNLNCHSRSCDPKESISINLRSNELFVFDNWIEFAHACVENGWESH